MKKRQKTKQPSIDNLSYVVSKLGPISARIKELEKELEPLQEQEGKLEKTAQAAANAVWDDSVQRAATEWRSTRGDDELEIAWVDAKFNEMPPEVLRYYEYEADMLDFFKEVKEALEG